MKPNYLFIICSAILLFNTKTALCSDLNKQSKPRSQTAYPSANKALLVSPTMLNNADWKLLKVNYNMTEFSFGPKNKQPYSPDIVVFRREDDSASWRKYDFYENGQSKLYSKTKYIEKTDTGWSQIKTLGPTFEKKEWGIMSLSASQQGTFVFDDYKSGDVLRISRLKNGKREAPTLLGPHINQGKWTAHPYMAYDESFLLWDSERKEGYGRSDIYVSFKQSDGQWGKAINLGPKVNTSLVENGARVSIDGKYLIFHRAEEIFDESGKSRWVSSKHWIDAQIIKDLRPHN